LADEFKFLNYRQAWLASGKVSGHKTLALNCTIIWQRCYKDDTAEEWSNLDNWIEEPFINARTKRERESYCSFKEENV